MNISEDTFVSWSKGPSETEAAKCENAETAVRKAIEASAELQKLDITVFAQGSYRARTNVRQNSDVDICVRYNSAFYEDYPSGTTRETFGNVAHTSLKFSDFKNLLQKALEDRFGKSGVTRGNKAFDVHANTYRIDADVVPTFGYRWYTGGKNADGTHHFHEGVSFFPDAGSQIINWPQQTYDHGVSRNTETGRAYKRTIRILKRLRDKMSAENIDEAKKTPSFLLECLAWNTTKTVFEHDTYTKIVRALIVDLWNRTKTDADCSEWGEVNELKYLFRASQPWTRDQVRAFLERSWNYIGYT
jgi:hypothetical protein